MGFLNYSVRPRVLVVGNGHTYDRTALMAMFESFDGMECFWSSIRWPKRC